MYMIMVVVIVLLFIVIVFFFKRKVNVQLLQKSEEREALQQKVLESRKDIGLNFP